MELTMQSIQDILAVLKEDTMYDVELVPDSCTGQAEVLKGKIQKKSRSSGFQITETDGYESEGDIVEKVTYTYNFLQNGEKIGELKEDKEKLYLQYKDRLGHLLISSCYIRFLAPLKL